MFFDWYKMYYLAWLSSTLIKGMSSSNEGLFNRLICVMARDHGLPCKPDGTPNYWKWSQSTGRDVRRIERMHKMYPTTFVLNCTLTPSQVRECYGPDAQLSLDDNQSQTHSDHTHCKYVSTNFVKFNDTWDLFLGAAKQLETETHDGNSPPVPQVLPPMTSEPTEHDVGFDTPMPASRAQVEQRRVAGRSSARRKTGCPKCTVFLVCAECRAKKEAQRAAGNAMNELPANPNCLKCRHTGRRLDFVRNPENFSDVDHFMIDCECTKKACGCAGCKPENLDELLS